MVQNNIITKKNTEVAEIENLYENYTIIEIDHKSYAIKTQDILEVTKVVELDKPEGILSCVLGIIHYKKEPVGVIDLREVFKKERIVYNLNSKIVIIQDGNVKIGIICDKVLDMRKLQKDKIFSVSYQDEGNFYDGIHLSEDIDTYIINAKKIVEYIYSNVKLFKAKEDSLYIVNDENSKEILRTRRNALIEFDNSIQPNVSLYDSGVSFLINNVKYYINMASVKEFYRVKKSKFIKVPCTKDYIFGLINIKGEYITVIDIKNLFYNSKTNIKEKSIIIILNSQEYKIGVLADEICESMNIDFDEIVQNRFQKNSENKMTEFVKDDEIYQVLDIDQLLKDDRLTVA